MCVSCFFVEIADILKLTSQKLHKADIVSCMMRMILEQMFENAEGKGMEKKMEEKLEQQRMQEATLLFQQLSPEKREEILRMMKKLGKK